MINLQTFTIALCVFKLAGIAIYAVDTLLPGTELGKQADAIRRNTINATTLSPYSVVVYNRWLLDNLTLFFY